MRSFFLFFLFGTALYCRVVWAQGDVLQMVMSNSSWGYAFTAHEMSHESELRESKKSSGASNDGNASDSVRRGRLCRASSQPRRGRGFATRGSEVLGAGGADGKKMVDLWHTDGEVEPPCLTWFEFHYFLSLAVTRCTTWFKTFDAATCVRRWPGVSNQRP